MTQFPLISTHSNFILIILPQKKKTEMETKDIVNIWGGRE